MQEVQQSGARPGALFPAPAFNLFAVVMPSNGQFGFSIIVGGKELPEYHHPDDNTRVLVESVLWTPVTYWLTVKEYCKTSEEIETQKWPVTPYEIKVYVEATCRCKYHYKVFVDGVKVSHLWLDRGESKIISGFPEEDGSYKEFLFSLPRFANDEKDRVGDSRGNKVGKIEVICYETTFSHTEMRYGKSTSKTTDFKQATKEDVCNVTKKKYTMATTRAGRHMREGKPYDLKVKKEKATPLRPHEVSMWNIGDEVQKLHVEYHMTHTLYDWGIEPVRPMWPEKDMGAAEVLKD